MVAYHLGHLGGGWIGVDVFFVLSGYLITTLMLEERAARGRINLRSFWARRARRLLPAVLLLLCALSLYAWAGGPGIVAAQLRAPALATLFYVANWQQIIAAHSYFAAFSAPDPLVHTWSLAIEEQYYVVWPLVVVGLGWLAMRAHGNRSASRRAPGLLVGATVVLLVASVIWMGVCAHVLSINRAYLGTDTRAWELLLGGLTAMLTLPERSKRSKTWATVALVAAGGSAAVIVAAGAGGALAPQPWVWDGGLFAAGVCSTLVLLACIKAPFGPLARVLSLPPLRWLGRVSYSLYLWHLPAIVLITPADTGVGGAGLLLVRLGAMTAGTCASYYLVEQPLRRADWQRWRGRLLVPASFGLTAALVLAGTVTPAVAGTGGVGAVVAANGAHALVAAPGFGLRRAERPSRSHPLRVWIMGDSVMNDSSPGITAALQATGEVTVVANSSFGGWGLSTDTTWPHDFEQIIKQYRPQLVIGTWSWDDQLAEAHPASYEALLHRAVATMLAPGDGVEAVVLVQFPQTGPNPYLNNPAEQHAAWVSETTDQETWDRIAREVSGQFADRAAYLTTAQLFAPHGRFLVWMRNARGHWVRARKIDNAHMCPYGAAEFGELVTSAFRKPLGLGPMRPGWQNGAWTKDPRYNDPAGACPDDQPPPHYDGLLVPVPKKSASAGARSATNRR